MVFLRFPKHSGGPLQWGKTRILKEERAENWVAEAIVAARDAVTTAISNIDGRGTDIYRKVRILHETDFNDFIKRFANPHEIEKRIIFYFAWKTFCKNTAAIIDERLTASERLFDYLIEFVTTFEVYQEYKGEVDDRTSVISLENSCYGEQIAFNYGHLLGRLEGRENELICGPEGEFREFWNNMMVKLDGKHPDIVIMDPPYGFNTDSESL